MIRKGYKIWRDFSTQMRKQNISAYAASMAFFLFLSLVPMLVVICTVIPYTPLTEQNLIAVITGWTPDSFDPIAESLIDEVYEKSAGIMSIAILATIWSAGKGVLSMMLGLNAIHGVVEKRNYFVVRLFASFYTVIMLIATILSLVIMVFGDKLVEVLLYRVPKFQILASFAMNFRFLFVWGVLTMLFAMIYAYIPNVKLKFKEQVFGASFTAVVWSVFSWGFSLYVERTQSYSIYGSLSIVVLVMIWMYTCMYIMLIGAYLNKYVAGDFQKNEIYAKEDREV